MSRYLPVNAGLKGCKAVYKPSGKSKRDRRRTFLPLSKINQAYPKKFLIS
jgi:hypothetical protein